MKRAGWITFTYGLVVLIGGVMGHIKAGSQISLIMGTVFGALLLMAGVGTFKNRLFPAYFGIILTIVLAAFFTYRYLFTFAFFPAGAMCLISIAVLVLQIIFIRRSLKNQRKSR